MERNLCKESNCPAACCRNIEGHLPTSDERFLQAFPDAKLVEEVDILKQKIETQERGVFYTRWRGWIYFSISGVCPNLNEDFSCKIHGERFYPRACVNMLVESAECEDAKEIYKLKLITG